jgi:hypothetical protein
MVIGHVAADPFKRLTSPISYHSALYLKPDDPCQCKGDLAANLRRTTFRRRTRQLA